MTESQYPEEFLAKLNAVKAKRAKRVIEHILKHGQITTEELKDVYGYGHPPRAARDVREKGIPLVTVKVKAKDGRTIAAYRFPDVAVLRGEALSGRANFPKAFKKQLIDHYGKKCALCSTEFDAAFLQIDHRIPYEVGGQATGELNVEDYMLVCRTCNRGKSWSCEHCPNWIKDKKPATCQTCFWCQPLRYAHIATLKVRRLNLAWGDKEVAEYDRLVALSNKAEVELPDFVKAVLRKHSEPGSTRS